MHYARPLIAGSAAVLAAILGPPAAFAATTWTINRGGAISSAARGLFNDNDPLTISGTFPLSPKQKITSP